MDESANSRTEGITERVQLALDMFVKSVVAHYADRLKYMVIFGSRVRGTAHSQSDLDVAVILDDLGQPSSNERSNLANLAYDVIVETGVDIQPVPIPLDEWKDPFLSRNPGFIRSIQRDGIRYDIVS